jgi:ribose/xylose/arabinose/galactoside ABC-type transport system permease subunit
MKELTLLFVLLLLLLLFYALAPKFMNIENIKNILVQNAYIVVASIGMSIVIIGGGIDMSIGYQISLVGVVTTISMQWFGLPVWFSVFIGLATGTLLGTVNGFLSVRLRVHPMIVTLATMAIYQGISYIITNSNSIYGLSDSFKFIGQGMFLGIPISILVMLAILLIASFFLAKTYPGRYVYALGGNAEAARLSGVNTAAVRVMSFAICGFFVAVASILLVSRSGSMNSSVGAGTEFTCITAAVLGGVSMAGGEGKVWKVCIGAIILGVLSNGMQFIGLGVYPQYVAKGVILMAAISFDTYQKNARTEEEKTEEKQVETQDAA